jgi:small conductance mechanosensitive channel
LHTIPFGEFKVISNMSKDFSYAVVELHASYKDDVDKVVAVIKAVAAEVRKDPDVGPVIRGDFEMFGPEKLGEQAIMYRGRFKTLPGRGVLATRAFNRLIRRAIEAEGIEIPSQRATMLVMQNAPAPQPPRSATAQEAAQD